MTLFLFAHIPPENENVQVVNKTGTGFSSSLVCSNPVPKPHEDALQDTVVNFWGP